MASSAPSSSSSSSSSSVDRSSVLIDQTLQSIEANFRDFTHLTDRKRRGESEAEFASESNATPFRFSVDPPSPSPSAPASASASGSGSGSSFPSSSASGDRSQRSSAYLNDSQYSIAATEKRSSDQFSFAEAFDSPSPSRPAGFWDSSPSSSESKRSKGRKSQTDEKQHGDDDGEAGLLDSFDSASQSPVNGSRRSAVKQSNSTPKSNESINANFAAFGDDQTTDYSVLKSIDASTWPQRVHALKAIQALCSNSEALQDVAQLKAKLAPLAPDLVLQLSDSLSKIVKESCLTIALIAAALNQQFEPFLPVVDSLMTLLKAKSAVIHSSADECLLTIIEETRLTAVFQSLLKALNVHQSKLKGESIGTLAVLLAVAVHRWPISELAPFRLQLIDLLKFLFSGAVLPKSLKSASRLLFFRFHEKFPSEGRDFFGQLNQLNQNLIHQEFPESGLKPLKPIESLHLMINPAEQYERLSAASKMLLNAFPGSHPIHLDKKRSSQSASGSATPQRSPRAHLIGVSTLRLSDVNKAPLSPAYKGAPVPNTPAYENLHSELSKQRAENIRLQEELQKIQQRSIKAQQILSEKSRLEQENETLKKQVEKSQQMQQQLNQSLTSVRIDNDKQTKTKVENLKQLHAQEIQQIQQQHEERIEGEVKELRVKIEQLEIEKRGLIKRNEGLLAKLRAYEKQMDEMDATIERLKFDLTAAEQERDALKSKEEQWKEMRQEEKSKIEDKWRGKLEQADKEIARQRQEIEELSRLNEEMRRRGYKTAEEAKVEEEAKLAQERAKAEEKRKLAEKKKAEKMSTQELEDDEGEGQGEEDAEDSFARSLDSRMAKSMEFFRRHYKDPSTEAFLANIDDLKQQIQTLEKRAKEKRMAAQEIERELAQTSDPETRERLQQRLKALKLQCGNIEKTLREKKEKFQQNWDQLLKHAQKKHSKTGSADGLSASSSAASAAMAMEGSAILDKYKSEQAASQSAIEREREKQSEAKANESILSKPRVAGVEPKLDSSRFASSNRFSSSALGSSASSRDFQSLAAQLRRAISSPIATSKLLEPTYNQTRGDQSASVNSGEAATAILNVTISPEHKQVHIQHLLSPPRNSAAASTARPTLSGIAPLPLPPPISPAFSRSAATFASSKPYDPSKSFSHSINFS